MVFVAPSLELIIAVSDNLLLFMIFSKAFGISTPDKYRCDSSLQKCAYNSAVVQTGDCQVWGAVLETRFGDVFSSSRSLQLEARGTGV